MSEKVLLRALESGYVKKAGPTMYLCLYHGVVDKDHVCVFK